MKMRQLVPVILIILLPCGWALAQDDAAVKKHPGYIDLEQIKIPADAGEVTDINIGPGLMRMLAALGDEDQDIERQMKDFFSIRVRSFEMHPEMMESILETMQDIEKKLEKEKWESLIRVKNRDERVNVSIKYDTKNRMQGLLIMAMDPDDEEVTFVNLVGKINIGDLANLGVGLNGSALDSLKKLERLNEWDDDEDDQD